MSKQTPEGKLKAECRAWLRQEGAYVFSPVQVGMGTTTVDDLVCYKGHFLAIEYKRPDTRPKPTLRQTAIMFLISAAEGLAICAYDIEDVKHACSVLRGPSVL